MIKQFKKIMAFVALVIITSQTASAQWVNIINEADSTLEVYGAYTNKILEKSKDSINIGGAYYEFNHNRVLVKRVNSTYNDGAMNSFVWADASGNLKRSPTPSPTQGVSRSFNSSFRVSTTKSALVYYTVEISSTLSLTAGQTGRVYLEISPDNSTWTEVSHETNSNTGTLIIGLNTAQIGGGVLSGYVPQGWYVRLRTNGTSTFTYSTGQEVIMF